MRSGLVYERVDIIDNPTEGTHYVSVTSHGYIRVKLHSRVSKYVEGLLPESFLGTLRSFTNQNM